MRDLTPFAAAFVILAPISIGAAVFLWHLWHEDHAAPGEPTGFSLVLAITGTIGALVSTYLAWASWHYLAGNHDLVRALGPLTLAAFWALGAVPILNAAYLRWLRQGRR
jgi:hypothetical protein